MHPLLVERIRDYAAAKRRDRSLSKTTLDNYEDKLRAYNRFVGATATLAALQHNQIETYIETYSDRHPRSVHNTLFAIRSFCRWLVKRQELPADPTLGISLPSLPAARRQTVDDDTVRELVAACRRLPNRYKSALAVGLFAAQVYGGLRTAEVLDLLVEDVDFKVRTLFVRCGKGGKSRTVYPCDEFFADIQHYLLVRPKLLRRTIGGAVTTSPAPANLFLQSTGKPLHDDNMRALFGVVKIVAGHEDAQITPHCLRHACASRMLANGASIEDIRDFLGHSSIVTTAIYLHTNEKRLRQIAPMTSLNYTRPDTRPQQADAPPQKNAPAVTPQRQRIPVWNGRHS